MCFGFFSRFLRFVYRHIYDQLVRYNSDRIYSGDYYRNLFASEEEYLLPNPQFVNETEVYNENEGKEI